jgi:prophage regulatory protein
MTPERTSDLSAHGAIHLCGWSSYGPLGAGLFRRLEVSDRRTTCPSASLSFCQVAALRRTQLCRRGLHHGPKKRKDTDSGKRCVARCEGYSVRRPRLDPRIHSSSPLLFKRTVRRPELRKIVPSANTTIYEMEQRREFPRRFFLTSRCVVSDLAEVEAWIEERRRASDAASIQRAPTPDVRKRKTRPVRHQ